MNILSNLAYDYKRFEEQKETQITPVKMVPKPKKKPVLAKSVCCMIVIVIMLSALIYTKVVQSEISSDYNAAVKQLNLLKGENSRLQIKSEKEFSSDTIERIARDDLKMQKIDNSRIEYIQFNNQDNVEVLKKQTFFDTISGWISGFLG